MLLHSPRLPYRMAEGPVQVQHPRRPDVDRHLSHQGQGRGGDAAGLDLSREQSHGPRAQGSSGYQQGEVHPFVPHRPGDLPAGGDQSLSLATQAEAIVPAGDPADDPLRLELAEPLEREHEVDVAEGVPAVVRQMGDGEVVGIRGPRDDANVASPARSKGWSAARCVPLVVTRETVASASDRRNGVQGTCSSDIRRSCGRVILLPSQAPNARPLPVPLSGAASARSTGFVIWRLSRLPPGQGAKERA